MLSFSNWRFNPFTEATNNKDLMEFHKSYHRDDIDAYCIQLHEGIELNNPSTLEVWYGHRIGKYCDTSSVNSGIEVEIHVIDGFDFTAYGASSNAVGVVFTTNSFMQLINGAAVIKYDGQLAEVDVSIAPSVGEYRVDYDAENYYSTSYIDLNSDDDNKMFVVKYTGTGMVVKTDYSIYNGFNVPGDLYVGGSIEFEANGVKIDRIENDEHNADNGALITAELAYKSKASRGNIKNIWGLSETLGVKFKGSVNQYIDTPGATHGMCLVNERIYIIGSIVSGHYGILVYDSNTDTLLDSLELTTTSALTDILYDGTHVWVSAFSDNSLYKVEVVNNTLVSTITLTEPTVMTYNGTSVWICANTADIYKIDIVSDTATLVNFGHSFNTPTSIIVGNNTNELIVEHDGIYKLEISSESVLDSVTLSNSYHITFDGFNYWVSNASGSNIYWVDKDTFSTNGTVSLSGSSNGIIFDGKNIVVVQGTNLVKIDTIDNSIEHIYPVAYICEKLYYDGTYIYAIGTDLYRFIV